MEKCCSKNSNIGDEAPRSRLLLMPLLMLLQQTFLRSFSFRFSAIVCVPVCVCAVHVFSAASFFVHSPARENQYTQNTGVEKIIAYTPNGACRMIGARVREVKFAGFAGAVCASLQFSAVDLCARAITAFN